MTSQISLTKGDKVRGNDTDAPSLVLVNEQLETRYNPTLPPSLVSTLQALKGSEVRVQGGSPNRSPLIKSG